MSLISKSNYSKVNKFTSALNADMSLQDQGYKVSSRVDTSSTEQEESEGQNQNKWSMKKKTNTTDKHNLILWFNIQQNRNSVIALWRIHKV